jgi:hypothetical protein
MVGSFTLPMAEAMPSNSWLAILSIRRPSNGPERGGTRSAEFALDWMFWPTKNLGWFIEPA